MRLLLLLIAITWQVASTDAAQQRVLPRSRTLGTFADRSLKVVAEDVRGNFVFSSISLAMILSMISAGAAGNTKTQIISAIEKPYLIANQRTTEPTESNSDERKAFVLRVANKIFLAKGFTPKRDFSSIMASVYHSTVESVDFSRSAQASKTINDWCEAQTNNLIKQLVQPTDFNSETSVVLVNAVYFKAYWVKEFNQDETTMRPFHVNRMTVKRVPTMRRVGSYSYGTLPEVKAKFIELPYVRNVKDQPMSMFIVLPDEIDGIVELIRNFEKVTIEKLRKGEMWDLELLLPKFKVDTKLDLESSLVKLGVTDMFGPSADFSGITVERPLTVSKIVQKNFVGVNEQGTEAASASGTQLDSRFHEEPEITFRVDRPFVSLIVNRIGMPYFTAVIVDPIN